MSGVGVHFAPGFRPSQPRLPRNNDVDAVHAAFQRRLQLEAKTVPRVVVLTGPPGVGKSWLAREYVAQHGAGYRLVVWVDATSRWHVAYYFVRLAAQLGLQHVLHEPPMDVVAHVLTHLNTTGGWLLVLDGGEGDLRALTTFLPTLHGCVLVTAHQFVCGCGFDETEHQVLPFAEERVAQYIAQASPPEGTAGVVPTPVALARRCEGLALRMALTAAILAHGRLAPRQLLQRLKREAAGAGPDPDPSPPEPGPAEGRPPPSRQEYLAEMERQWAEEQQAKAEAAQLAQDYGSDEEEEPDPALRRPAGPADAEVLALVRVALEGLAGAHWDAAVVGALAQVTAALAVAEKGLLQQWLQYYRNKRPAVHQNASLELEELLAAFVRHRILEVVDVCYTMHPSVAQAVLTLHQPSDDLALGVLMRRLGPAARAASLRADAMSLLPWHAALAAATARHYVRLRPAKLAIKAANRYLREVLVPNAPAVEQLSTAHRQAHLALHLVSRVLDGHAAFPYPHAAADEALAHCHLAQCRATEAIADVTAEARAVGRTEGLDLVALAQEEADYALGAVGQFLERVRAGDRAGLLAMWRQSRLLAYLGHVDWPDVSGVALCANPFAEEVLPLIFPSLTYQEHLALWTDLTDAEVAKLHGNDWEGTRRAIRLPILEAVRTGDPALVELFVNAGVSLRCCSPHDMLTPLQLAVQCEHIDVVRVLLPHCDPLYAPPYVLDARRDEALAHVGVRRGPAGAAPALDLALPRRAVLETVLLHAPVPPAVVEARLMAFMATLQTSSPGVLAALFAEGFAYHALAPQALQTLLHLFNEHAARQLLPCLSPQQCSDVLFTSPNVDIVAFLLRFGPDRDLNVTRDGLHLVLHHTAAGHLEVVMYLLRNDCDAEVVTPGERLTIMGLANASGHRVLEQSVRRYLDERDWSREAAARSRMVGLFR